MDSTKFKFLASQARTINKYKNTRSKLLKCGANIYFNKKCLSNNVTPKYARIKFTNNSPAAIRTSIHAQILRVKNEIKLLYKKKDNLNQDLYALHLQAAREWGSLWPLIQSSIIESLNTEMTNKYLILDKKLNTLINTKNQNQHHDTQFYPRVINKTKINFTDNEMSLLNKGLKYNLSYKNKHWLRNLALEAESAVARLPTNEQEHVRYQVAINLEKLYKQDKNKYRAHDHKINIEKKTINQIKTKLQEAKAMITKADKGNSIVIIYTDDYNKKIYKFINDNKFNSTTQDITNKLQRNVRSTVNECTSIIPKDKRWKYVNLNPSTPKIRGLIKIHKVEAPIRPIVNWQNAPAYKLAKLLIKQLQLHIPLPYTFNVKNTTHLIHDISNIPFNNKLRLASFDIVNMYTNIPTDAIPPIINLACCNNHVDESIRLDLAKLTKTLLDQNCFHFDNMTFIQPDGLAMGAPTSSILSEFYLQHLEIQQICDLLLHHRVEGYFRFVDDILIIYNEDNTDIENLLNHFNNLTPTLKFTIEKESNRQLHFMDITITRTTKKFETDVYRKPTYTDAIIPRDSCHPEEQKMAAIRFFYNRLYQYQLSPVNKEKENRVINAILHNNGYDISSADKILKNIQDKKTKTEQKTGHWVKFTYVGSETRTITKVFKNTNINIALSVNNTLGKQLATKQQQTKQKYDQCGIYQLTCPTCNKKYTGQTGRPFKIRFQEHFRDFKYRNGKSSFAQHLIENGHPIGPIENIMDTIHITSKGHMMDALENFYIFRETKQDNQINDRMTVKPNAIFDVILNNDSATGTRFS